MTDLRGRQHQRARGQIIVVVPIALLAFLGLLGLVVDVGFFNLAQSELQNAADAAALAAVWYDPVCPLSDSRCAPDNASIAQTASPDAASEVARQYASVFNGQLAATVCQSTLDVSPQEQALNVPRVNAITVVVKCQARLFGGSLFGLAPVEVWAAGTAAIGSNDGSGNMVATTPSGGVLVGRLVRQS